MVRNEFLLGLRFYDCVTSTQFQHCAWRWGHKSSALEEVLFTMEHRQVKWSSGHNAANADSEAWTGRQENTEDGPNHPGSPGRLPKEGAALLSWIDDEADTGQGGREGACGGQRLGCRQQKLNSRALIIKLQRQAEKYNPVIVPLLQAIAICRVFSDLLTTPPHPQILTQPRNQTQKNHFPFSGTSTCTNTQAFSCFHPPPPSWFWFQHPAVNNQEKRGLSLQSRRWEATTALEF